MACIHRDLCLNDCPCDYYAEEKQFTRLLVDFSGNYVTYSHCENCGQPITYPTERPYNVCPYCTLRVIKEDKK